jgi:endonuclease/exonuclease/phosphatase family metal-dependent hydrolase
MDISVVTYNIHSCLGTDSKWLPVRINRVIAGFAADIIGLQEVGWHLRGRKYFDQYEYLRRHSGYHVIEGPVKQRVDAHFGNALLTRQPPAAVRKIDLTVRGHVPRGAIDADVEVGGALVRIINMHLGLTPWERRRQLQQIAEALDQRPDAPTVIMGDFNHWRPGSASTDRLEKRLPHMIKGATWHTRMAMVPFDRILASSDFEVVDSRVVRTKESRIASDHFPLCATLRLAAGAGRRASSAQHNRQQRAASA